MSTPTARLLELLELRQSRPAATGREIADRLGISTETVREYVHSTYRKLHVSSRVEAVVKYVNQ